MQNQNLFSKLTNSKLEPDLANKQKYEQENVDDLAKKISEILKNVDLNKNEKFLGFSMSGCGFLGSYHFGAVICFKRHAKKIMANLTHISGSSVGSLLAALLILAPNSLEDALNELYALADEINSYALGALAPGFYIAERLSLLVDKYIPEDISLANDRLFISVTKQSNYKNRMIFKFPSRDYLLKCLNASCYIPIYSMGYFSSAPEIDGEKYIDGGYSNNLPIFKDFPTISISPFSGSAIIAPSDKGYFDWKMRLGNQIMKVNLQNVVRGAHSLFPPSTTMLKMYYNKGYIDAMKFLLTYNFFEREEGTEL